MATPKRPAVSPLSEAGEEKRPYLGADSSLEEDPEATIITGSEMFSSTHIDPDTEVKSLFTTASSSQSSSVCLGAVADALKIVLGDSSVLQTIAKAVAGEVKKDNEKLLNEIASLKEQVASKDSEILSLQDRIDDLEQYSRRNCLRISNIPEKAGEDTDQLVCVLSEAVGVPLPVEAVERSHRLGRTRDDPVPAGTAKPPPRQIIVKLQSYRHREQLMRARKNLKSVDLKATFPDLSWSSVPVPAGRGQGSPRVYLNEDLTRERARLAATARDMKKGKRVLDTWTRDGAVFVKRLDSSIIRVTSLRQLSTYF